MIEPNLDIASLRSEISNSKWGRGTGGSACRRCSLLFSLELSQSARANLRSLDCCRISRKALGSHFETGLLVSVYALGVAVGGPAVVAITTSQSRKRTLLQLCAIFVVGHALAALAPDYGLLMGARVLAAVSHASFLGIAAIVAAASVPSERSARAVSLVWLGFSAASLVGVPGATAIGHALGWRAAFGMLAAVGVVAGMALQLWMPGAPRAKQQVLVRRLSPCGVRKCCLR